MARSQPDETFFVEFDEPAHSQYHPRDVAKMIALNRQEVIAGELSRLAADEYLDDILQHMDQMENETLADAGLIDMQREIQWFMRPYLIDFLVEAHSAFGLYPETLFLTVNLLDRYCSRRVVYKQHYQLVGCAALLIASKYGDKKDRVPQIHELNNMCCGLYDAGMFTQMEMHVLNTLDWVIGHPTVDFFSQLFAAEERDDTEVQHLAAYLSEIAMYHRDFVSLKPSAMARASLSLARTILNRADINDAEVYHSRNPIVVGLSNVLEDISPTLSRKYSKPQYSRVHLKLEDFLLRRAELSRLLAAPPSPPCEPAARHGDIYSTPSKPTGAAAMGFDGYMTPPITPDGVTFGNPQQDSYPLPPRCPVTPTPRPSYPAAYHQHVPQHVPQHVQQQYTGYVTHPHYGIGQP